MANGLTPSQISAIVIVQLVSAVLSLIGCLFIIATFTFSQAFRRPINRLVFYASFGNLLASITGLMGRDFVNDVNSFGCQFQGFLAQLCVPAGAYWMFAMAVNVYLTFYLKFDAPRLRRMDKWYFLLCYGIPFIPALTFIFISTPSKGRMYGDAEIKCWITQEWDVLRIATFYAPAWVAIILTFAIYIRAGGTIYKKHKELRYFGSSTTRDGPELSRSTDNYPVKTVEVEVTTEDAISLATLEPRRTQVPPGQQPNDQYSVRILSAPERDEFSLPIQNPQTTVRPPPRISKRRKNYELNKAAWAYAKCALLFFVAILVVWTPLSANRVYTLVRENQISWVLEILSAFFSAMQGFWNTVIYVSTSWDACKMLVLDILSCSLHTRTMRSAASHNDRKATVFKLTGRPLTRRFESESMTQLASATRPESKDTRDPSV